jgi:plastocyanin
MSLKSRTTRRFLASGYLGVVVMALFLAGCGGSSSSVNTSTPPTATTAPTSAPTSPPATVAPTTAPASPTAVSGNSAAVTIQNFSFSPQVITVKVGTTITWTDKDTTAHTVTSLSGPTSFDSGHLTPSGGTFHFTFSQAGTYNYHCMIHPSMTATVIVVS